MKNMRSEVKGFEIVDINMHTHFVKLIKADEIDYRLEVESLEKMSVKITSKINKIMFSGLTADNKYHISVYTQNSIYNLNDVGKTVYFMWLNKARKIGLTRD